MKAGRSVVELAQRIGQVETTLGGLRSQVSLLEQIHHAEQVLAAVRADTSSTGASRER